MNWRLVAFPIQTIVIPILLKIINSLMYIQSFISGFIHFNKKSSLVFIFSSALHSDVGAEYFYNLLMVYLCHHSSGNKDFSLLSSALFYLATTINYSTHAAFEYSFTIVFIDGEIHLYHIILVMN